MAKMNRIVRRVGVGGRGKSGFWRRKWKEIEKIRDEKMKTSKMRMK